MPGLALLARKDPHCWTSQQWHTPLGFMVKGERTAGQVGSGTLLLVSWSGASCGLMNIPAQTGIQGIQHELDTLFLSIDGSHKERREKRRQRDRVRHRSPNEQMRGGSPATITWKTND